MGMTAERGLKAVFGYGMLALFLVTYRQLFCLMGEKSYSYWLAIQLGIVFVLGVWYDPNNLFMGFFPANFIGWYPDKKQFNRALASFVCVLAITVVIIGLKVEVRHFLYMIPFIAVMLSTPFGIRSLNSKIELETKLDKANEKIKELIKREERIRIARDLHDTLGHTLSLITLQSQLVQRLAEKHPERAKTEAKEIELTSRSALRQVRELVSEMRAITVAEELSDMEQILSAAGIAFDWDKNADLSGIPLLQQNILGMCLREAGTNIVKHSSAKKSKVTFERTRGSLIISVRDDGVGLPGDHRCGNGLKGMKERLALVEGELSINSSQGTVLTITVPIVSKQEKEGIA